MFKNYTNNFKDFMEVFGDLQRDSMHVWFIKLKPLTRIVEILLVL